MSFKTKTSPGGRSIKVTIETMVDAIRTTLSRMARIDFATHEVEGLWSEDSARNWHIAGRFQLGVNEILILFSDSAVFQAMDYLAGGHDAHFTPIENRPPSKIDLMMLEVVLRNSVSVMQEYLGEEIAFVGLQESAEAINLNNDAKNIPNISLTMTSPKGSGEVLVFIQAKPFSIAAAKRNLASSPADVGTAAFPQLDTKIIVEWLSSELPQTVALALSLMDRKQSAQVIMRLPEPLAIDAAARFVCMRDANPSLKLILMRFAEMLANKGGQVSPWKN